jgi:multidrug efflux pump subunit AcrA (membrane-fusion protein)
MANRASARQMVVLLLLCLAGFTGECLAQPPVVPAGVSVNPLDRKEVARARFEATRSPQRSLNQARVEAARVVVMVVAENYQAGRRGGTLDGFLEAAYQLLEVERALRGPGADPTPFAEKYWELAWASEALSLARYEAGSENIAEVAAARHDRLQAEINWARARRRGGKAGEPVEKFLDLLFEEITPKDLAQAKFEATQSDIPALQQDKLQAARVRLLVRAENYRVGRHGAALDGFLEAAHQLLEAHQALLGPGADPTPFAEKHWELAWASQALSRARYEAGSENIAEVAAARHDRLQAEINWARARRHGGKAGEPVEKFPDLLFEEITPKDLAQAKFEATQSDIPALQQDKLQAARVRLLVRVENYRAGRRGGTLDALLEAARWVLQAERDLLGPGADPTPFLEKHWELAWTTEALSRGRYEAGSDNIGDLMQARLARLEAELLLLQAHARQKK